MKRLNINELRDGLASIKEECSKFAFKEDFDPLTLA